MVRGSERSEIIPKSRGCRKNLLEAKLHASLHAEISLGTVTQNEIVPIRGPHEVRVKQPDRDVPCRLQIQTATEGHGEARAVRFEIAAKNRVGAARA